MNKHLVIFTDLDGTLLELETYSFQPAEAALHRVQARTIPLIFCSSKTRSEQEYYQRQMGLRAPMIVENGAAIIIPAGYFTMAPAQSQSDEVIELGVPVSRIRAELTRIRAAENLLFQGYAELSLEELQHWTGLDSEAARRAQQREYSETLVGVLTADEAARLNAALQSIGLIATQGSRFYTVTSSHNDKGKAVTLLTEKFRQQWGEVTTVGLGDGANDLPLLQAVDRSFLLRPDATEWSCGTGPVAWAKIVHRILDEIEN
jgi:mannosyl-3-phosphoglycerate phosphatase